MSAPADKTALILAACLALAIGCGGGTKQPRYTVIEVRAEGCDPCKKMDPVMRELRAAYGDRVRFEEHDIASGPGRVYVERYGLYLVPALLIVDEHGLVRHQSEGLFDARDVGAALDRLLKSPPAGR